MWWISLVSAEEIAIPSEAVELSEVELQLSRIEALQDKVRALEEEMAMQSDFAEQDGEIVTRLSVLVDSRQPDALRIEAAQQLATFQSPQVLPFLWEVLDGTADTSLNRAIVSTIPIYMSEHASEAMVLECRAILQRALYVSDTKASNLTVSVGDMDLLGSRDGERVIIESSSEFVLETLRSIQDPRMAELLMVYIKDEQVPTSLREQALADLQGQYSDWLADKEVPTIFAPVNKLANQIYAVSTGVTGSVLLGSVGVWGQNSTSEAIGYSGGALLGATSGWLLANQNHPTLAHSALMASSTGWGLAMGQMVADGYQMEEDFSALSRTVGVMAGTGYGHWARNRNMSLSDVLEADFSGYLGAQMAVAFTDIFTDQEPLQWPHQSDYYPEERDYEWDSPEAQAFDEAYQAANDAYYEAREQHQRLKLKMATMGSIVGLGASHTLMETWNPDPKSVLFAGVWSGQMGLAVDNLLITSKIEYPQGWVRLSAHTVMASALYYDHRHPVSYEQSIFAAYGIGAGYSLGYGTNTLFSDGRTVIGARNGSIIGTIGGLGGTYVGNKMEFTSSDWTTTAVGLGLTAWHSGTLGQIAEDYKWLPYGKAEGLVQTSLGVASLGLLGAGKYFDVSSTDAIYLGATTAWGAYYGALMPLALGVENSMTDTERLLTTVIASDVFLASGTYGLLSGRVQSENSAIPQVLGLTGATLGSLGAFLFTDSSQVVSGAAIVGATMGIGSGVLLNNRNEGVSIGWMPKKPKQLAGIQVRTAPYMDEQGDMGFYVGLSN